MKLYHYKLLLKKLLGQSLTQLERTELIIARKIAPKYKNYDRRIPPRIRFGSNEISTSGAKKSSFGLKPATYADFYTNSIKSNIEYTYCREVIPPAEQLKFLSDRELQDSLEYLYEQFFQIVTQDAGSFRISFNERYVRSLENSTGYEIVGFGERITY